LVEVALFLPIFVILIAGVVEISQLVITQNRVSNAARTAARFGANGGEDDGIVLVALNSVTQTLEMDENSWDMWTIHGKTTDDGNGFVEWSFDHTYGISQTALFNKVNETTIQQEILGDLHKDNQGVTSSGIAGDLRFVGTYILHDVDSIIGLDAFPALAQVSSVQALNVMRVTGLNLEPTKGCDAFPIAVSDVIRSVNPPGTGANPYPDAKDFEYPDGKKGAPPPPAYTDFVNHVPDVPLSQAKEGYIYFIKNGIQPGNFGWLLWNDIYQTGNANTLARSLTWPGDSNNYPEYGYYEPGDPTDTSLNIGDNIWGNTGTVASVAPEMEEHVDLERALRVIVWDTSTSQGSNVTYHVVGFAIFRIHGFSLAHNWLLAEFIRMDNSCGQAIAGTQ
ncbi:MAG: pilus assembly protein, partial [Ardenticatenaceae bacterium]|nr:pilus assembly protein [Ardenticatenaceae bacterium]